jgi:hypothetical protein
MKPGTMSSKSDEIGFDMVEFEVSMSHTSIVISPLYGMLLMLAGGTIGEDPRLLVHQNRGSDRPKIHGPFIPLYGLTAFVVKVDSLAGRYRFRF